MSAEDRFKHGLHPDWCDLGRECADDPKRDPSHSGMVSTMWPLADDVRIDVELVRSDDKAPAVTIEGETRVCLRLTNMASCNLDNTPIIADTYLSHGDAMALAHALQTYAKRLERGHSNMTAETIRNETSPIGDTAKVDA